MQEKSSCIGGTAASAILGVNPFKTKHEVWLELTGLADGAIRMNQRIEAGIRLEPYVADWFLDEMKNRGEKIGKRVRFSARELMITTNRKTGGVEYQRLEQAFQRLMGTTFQTDIQTGPRDRKRHPCRP